MSTSWLYFLFILQLISCMFSWKTRTFLSDPKLLNGSFCKCDISGFIFNTFAYISKSVFALSLWVIVCRLMRKKTIVSILEQVCNVTKCGKSEGVWIFSECTVKTIYGHKLFKHCTQRPHGNTPVNKHKSLIKSINPIILPLEHVSNITSCVQIVNTSISALWLTFTHVSVLFGHTEEQGVFTGLSVVENRGIEP